MSNSFDDQLRKQWEEKHFPVDNQHRQDMLALLESNRRKKGVFWWFGGLVVAVAVGGGLLYFMNGHEIISPVIPAPVVSELKANDVAQATNPTMENSNNQASAIKNESAVTGNASSSANHKDVKLNKQINSSGNHERVTGNKAAKKSTDQKTKIVAQKQNNIIAKKENIFSAAPNATNNEVIVIPNTSPAIVSQAVAVVVMPEDADVMPSVEAKQRNAYVTEPVESISFSEIMYSSANEIHAIKPALHRHAFSLFGESGLGFVPGVKNKYGAGWTFNAGGGVGYKLGSRTGVTLSAGYVLQNGGFDFERTSTVTQMDFWIRSNSNTLQPDKLHFIYSRIGLQYEMKRNIFSIFGGMQYLYGAQGTIVVKSANQFVPVQDESRYSWLNTDGMRRLLWNGEIVYGYRLTSRLNIRSGIKYYFSSIKLEDEDLRKEGYFWNGHFSSFSPTFTINYQLYGKR
ncbi:MAG TPA: hypothetical protein VFG10_07900 [Saprospiraceae bacterium]|nr:hypothetical protein [Saprospiraceae bacterium]